MSHDQVTASYERGYDQAYALYDEDKLVDAVDKAEELLEDSGLSRYYRIKCYLLIAACVDDWDDAEDLLQKSEMLWQMARAVVSRREYNSEVEAALAELRDGIDSVKQEHEAERPEYDEALHMAIGPDTNTEKLIEQAEEAEAGFGDEEDVEEMDANYEARVDQHTGKDETGEGPAKDTTTEAEPMDTGEPAPLYHHRHRPKGSTLPCPRAPPRPSIVPDATASGSPATFLPFRDPRKTKD